MTTLVFRLLKYVDYHAVCQYPSFVNSKQVQAAQLALGKALREARDQAGISQERLGELAGLHRTHISFLERGEKNASLGTLLKVADVLEIPVSKLLARMEQLMG